MNPQFLSLAFLSATVLALLSPAQAATAPVLTTPAPAVAPPAFGTYTWLKDKFKLFDARRDKAENRYIQDFNFFLRMQYQVEFLNPHGSNRLKGDIHNNSRHHSECWRIFRTGWNATMFENFKVTNYWNLGGMDTRDQYVQPAGGVPGHWDNRQTTYSLYRLSIDYMTKDVTYSLGKYEPLWAQEYRLSSATNVTVERSIIINQLRGECNYGVQAQNGKKDATWGWTLGTFLNGCNTSSNDVTRYNTGMYPRFNSDTSAFTLTSVTYDTKGVFATKKSRIYVDYIHNFANFDRWDKNPKARAAYSSGGARGMGAQDIFAISWEGTYDRLTHVHELIGALNINSAAPDAQNVIGYVFIPTYRITDYVEGVFRYQNMFGSNAVNIGSNDRLWGANYAGSSVVDAMHAFYLGANIYAFKKDLHAAKIMLGTEYIYTRGKTPAGTRGPIGWSFTAGVRTNF